VLALESEVASIFGREAALFVPSGTMANQLAVRAWCQPGDEVILHARSHIYNYESGAAAAVSGVTARTIDSVDGTMPVDAVRAALHLSTDPHFAPTGLVAMENTHNACGGRVVPLDHMAAVRAVAHDAGLPTHLDGARLWNAAAALGVAPAEVAKGFGTVSVCFSKGLGAPVGSCLVGDRDRVARAWRFRKMLGGGMRQAGVLAAAALHALHHHVDRLVEDHRRARVLAEALAHTPGVTVDVDAIETNLVYFTLDEGHPLVSLEDGAVGAAAGVGVGITGGGRRYRAALHLDIDDERFDRGLDSLTRVFAWNR
jgi:threonine aldolase